MKNKVQKTAIDPTEVAARQAIHNDSLILLKRFCRKLFGLNVVTSWYEDGVMGQIAPETLLEQKNSASPASFSYDCEDIVDRCKSAVVELNYAKKTIQPSFILPENSNALKRLLEGLSGIMPKAALLTYLATYRAHGATARERKKPNFIEMIAARDRILANKKALHEPIAPVTDGALNDIAARARKKVRPEINSARYKPKDDPAEILVNLLTDDDAKAALLKARQIINNSELSKIDTISTKPKQIGKRVVQNSDQMSP